MKKRRKANSSLSPLDRCSVRSTRNSGKPSVEKANPTCQAGSAHYVFKQDIGIQYTNMTSSVDSYPQPYFGSELLHITT